MTDTDPDRAADFATVSALFADAPREAVVWLECQPEHLRDLAVLLGPDRDPPTPGPGRRLLALTFKAGVEDLEGWPQLQGEPDDDPKALAYSQAYLHAVGLAAVGVARAADAGIAARVYAVRVQPAGATFPSNYQYASQQDDMPAGERG